jgi:uncharacterized membrane protein YedE/YeeE
MEIKILVAGFLFGGILQYARLNKYNVISGMATLEDFTVAKAIATAIGVGAILLNIEIATGLASYHVKPLILTGIIVGGLVFGSGMAILGYCPGTMAVSLGEGSLDTLTGILGGLAAGLSYTLISTSVNNILGPDLGSISLNSVAGSGFIFYLLLLIIGGIFILASFWMHKKEKTGDYKWLYAGIALAILNGIVFLTVTFNRPIGASTAYPYLADLLTGTTGNEYFKKIQAPGNWELIFLSGAFLAGLIISLFKREFKITMIHSRWAKYKGNSTMKRVVWSFIGGFVLITGARMAGGCTSGHIISGGMQLAVSSLLFAVSVFAGLLITGKVFYKR